MQYNYSMSTEVKQPCTGGGDITNWSKCCRHNLGNVVSILVQRFTAKEHVENNCIKAFNFVLYVVFAELSICFQICCNIIHQPL